MSNPNKESPKINDEDLIKTLTVIHMKLDHLAFSNLLLSTYVEYVVDKLSAKEDTKGNPLIAIDIEEFNKYANKRLEEIREETLEAQADTNTKDANTFLKQAGANLYSEVNLNE